MVRSTRAGPRRRALLAPFLVVVLLLVPAGGAQLPPTPLDPVLGPAANNATAQREVVLGPELTREDVDVDILMEFRDVDFDTLNVIFGGGKFSANARIQARIDLRVLAAARVSDAIENTIPGSGNVTSATGADSEFIPADAFRASLAGEALAAFQDEQEAKLAEYLQRTVPNVTVMNTQFEWTNVSPQDSMEKEPALPGEPDPSAAQFNDPTYPPLTLWATIDVQYLERTSLLAIVEKAMATPKTAREKAQEERVADAAAAYDRSAFGLLGIRQVLDLEAPEGWDLEVRVKLPEGFTFEEASPDVALAGNLREAQVVTLGKDASGDVLNPVALTLSNRFIVSVAMLCTILLAGTLLRFPVLLATNAIRRKMRS